MISSPSLLAAFLEAMIDGDAAREVPGLESALRARVDAGIAAWPALALEPARFAAYLGARSTAADLPPIEHAAEMWLTCACTHDVPGAVAAFMREYRPVVERAVHRVDATLRDEITQLVLASLVVREEAAPPRIAQYAGRSLLRTWITTVATRAALRARTDPRRAVQDSTSALADLTEDAAPDLAIARARYGGEFERALRDALGGLGGRERTLLRLHHAQGWSIDRLATFYNVGRSTAARWVVRAREDLYEACRALLVERLGITSSEFRSLAALVRSDLQVSLIRLLEEEGAPPDAPDPRLHPHRT